jgi:hypothetical protein
MTCKLRHSLGAGGNGIPTWLARQEPLHARYRETVDGVIISKRAASEKLPASAT